MNTDQNYRMLNIGEVLQPGDQFRDSLTLQWKETCRAGERVDGLDTYIRRPIPTPAASPWRKISGPVTYPLVFCRHDRLCHGPVVSAELSEPFHYNTQGWTHWMPLPAMPQPEPELSPVQKAWLEFKAKAPVDMPIESDEPPEMFKAAFEAGIQAFSQAK